MKFGAVVIGRNEGQHLGRCLSSLIKAEARAPVYVDSASTDGSAEQVREYGADVILLDMSLPFTAARARNAGFERLRKIVPELPYIQFVDADCEIIADWPVRAVSFLDSHPEIGVVCGRLRERHPEHSVYNWLCDWEWNGPTGETRACGGVAMIRASALESVGGYRNDLIAGEEPELCVRLRQTGWRIWRLETEMALHDAAITRFAQWWRRAVRSGYAFAQGAYLHGDAPERHWVWESRRAWLWGIWLPLACLVISIVFSPWGWAVWLVYPLEVLRKTARNAGSLIDRATLAFFHVLARFPEGWGQIKFMRDRLLRRQARLIEYK